VAIDLAALWPNAWQACFLFLRVVRARAHLHERFHSHHRRPGSRRDLPSGLPGISGMELFDCRGDCRVNLLLRGVSRLPFFDVSQTSGKSEMKVGQALFRFLMPELI